MAFHLERNISREVVLFIYVQIGQGGKVWGQHRTQIWTHTTLLEDHKANLSFRLFQYSSKVTIKEEENNLRQDEMVVKASHYPYDMTLSLPREFQLHENDIKILGQSNASGSPIVSLTENKTRYVGENAKNCKKILPSTTVGLPKIFDSKDFLSQTGYSTH